MRGGKNPLDVLETSRTAEASGVAVPMRNWAFACIKHKSSSSLKKGAFIFKNLVFSFY
jgi:hypothetical protein